MSNNNAGAGNTANGARNLYFLGPEGSFTHQAAIDAAAGLDGDFAPMPCGTAAQVMARVEAGDGWGVIAWENNVEGTVMPNLDMLIDADDVAGLARLGVDVAFDAFVRPDADETELHEVSAHPHGLAQCTAFATSHNLTAVPASSNAAACRDIKPGQVALGPAICGSLYGLKMLGHSVQDYEGARTDFLVVAPREDVRQVVEGSQNSAATDFETIVAFVPLSTGPGVLAGLLDMIRDAGLNMTSFMSRPIKGHVGTYSFIATLDAAPWQPAFRKVLESVTDGGDWAKTLAVYPRVERPHPPVDAWMLPKGGVRGASDNSGSGEAAAGKELLW